MKQYDITTSSRKSLILLSLLLWQSVWKFCKYFGTTCIQKFPLNSQYNRTDLYIAGPITVFMESISCSFTSLHNPCRVLANSRSRLQPPLSLALILQFLTPSLSASLITPSIHLRFGLPTHLLPSGLSKVIFLRGKLSCIRTLCPAHLSLVILIVATKSVSSYRRYSSSL